VARKILPAPDAELAQALFCDLFSRKLSHLELGGSIRDLTTIGRVCRKLAAADLWLTMLGKVSL